MHLERVSDLIFYSIRSSQPQITAPIPDTSSVQFISGIVGIIYSTMFDAKAYENKIALKIFFATQVYLCDLGFIGARCIALL